MHRLALMLSTVALALLSGCDTGSHNEIDLLAQEVMAIHDEAMAEMGNLHEQETALTDQMRTRQEQGGSTAGEQEAILLLQEAQQLMMAWMRQYRKPGPEVAAADARTYLLDQKQQIEQVRDLTERSLKTAARALSD